MVSLALRPVGQIAAWLLWHSMRVSLYDDLAAPAPPSPERSS